MRKLDAGDQDTQNACNQRNFMGSGTFGSVYDLSKPWEWIFNHQEELDTPSHLTPVAQRSCLISQVFGSSNFNLLLLHTHKNTLSSINAQKWRPIDNDWGWAGAWISHPLFQSLIRKREFRSIVFSQRLDTTLSLCLQGWSDSQHGVLTQGSPSHLDETIP